MVTVLGQLTKQKPEASAQNHVKFPFCTCLVLSSACLTDQCSPGTAASLPCPKTPQQGKSWRLCPLLPANAPCFLGGVPPPFAHGHTCHGCYVPTCMPVCLSVCLFFVSVCVCLCVCYWPVCVYAYYYWSVPVAACLLCFFVSLDLCLCLCPSQAVCYQRMLTAWQHDRGKLQLLVDCCPADECEGYEGQRQACNAVGFSPGLCINTTSAGQPCVKSYGKKMKSLNHEALCKVVHSSLPGLVSLTWHLLCFAPACCQTCQ